MGRIMLFATIAIIAVVIIVIVLFSVAERNRRAAIKQGKMAGLCRDCEHGESSNGMNCCSPLINENATSPMPVSKPCQEVRGTLECQFEQRREK
jgi:hypothetical protein